MILKTKDKESKLRVKKVEELYVENRLMMFRIAYSILNDKILSEDAVQQVFITVMSNFDKFKDLTEGRTKGLLIITTKNTCLNILKRKKVVEFISFDDEVAASSDENLIEDFIITNDSYSSLLRVITDLDEKYSAIF